MSTEGSVPEGGSEMKNSCIYFLFILSFGSAELLQAQWVQASVGCGGPVSCFATSGANLFAGIYSNSDTNGVYLTTNNGASWVPAGNGLTNHYVRSLVSSGGNVLAGTYGGGTFLSSNNGSSWTNSGLRGWSVTSFALLGSNLFAGTDYGGAVFSTNNGATWSYPANNGLSGAAICLAVSGTNLFAGGVGIFISTNNAASWSAVNNGLTDLAVECMAVSGTDLFVGTQDSGVYRSTDNGASWTSANKGLPSAPVTSLAVSGTNIFAGTMPGGIFLSTDSGISWRAVNTGLPFVATGITCIAVVQANLFAASVADGVWRRSISDILTAINENRPAVPAKFDLMQNYPNPFNPTTVIAYQLPTSSFVTLTIFDVLGRKVRTLVNERQDDGNHAVQLDASKLPSGVYFYRLHAGTFTETKKLTVLK